MSESVYPHWYRSLSAWIWGAPSFNPCFCRLEPFMSARRVLVWTSPAVHGRDWVEEGRRERPTSIAPRTLVDETGRGSSWTDSCAFTKHSLPLRGRYLTVTSGSFSWKCILEVASLLNYLSDSFPKFGAVAILSSPEIAFDLQVECTWDD